MDAVASPTLKIWPLIGQKFSAFGQSIELHSHVNEVVSIFPPNAKIMTKSTANSLRLFFHYFLPPMAKQTLPLSELETGGNDNRLHQIWANYKTSFKF